jgi:hypothetical protein
MQNQVTEEDRLRCLVDSKSQIIVCIECTVVRQHEALSTADSQTFLIC